MKKYLMMVLSVLIAIQAMTFGAFAAETKTELYNEDFNSYAGDASKENVIYSIITDVSPEGGLLNVSNNADKAANGTVAVSIRRSSGNDVAGRVNFDTASPVYNQTDANLMIEVQFDGNVTKMTSVKPTSSNKTMNADFLLGTSTATGNEGWFGGIRMTTRALQCESGATANEVEDWKIQYIDGAGMPTELAADISNTDVAGNMITFKVQYVFRENGAAKNVARVWVNGERKGEDIAMNITQTETILNEVGSMVVREYKIASGSPRVVMDNVIVNRIVSDDVTTEPEEPDPTPTPDPVYPVPEGDDVEPDVDLKMGTLAAFNFDKFDKASDDVLPIGWTTGKQAKYIVSTDGKNGRAFRLKGTASTETNLKTVFAPTGLNKDTAPLEGKNARVVTEFDMRLNNIQELAGDSKRMVDLQFGKDENDKNEDGSEGASNTPGIQIIFDKESFTYKTNGTTSKPVSYTQGEWLHFKITHLVTDVHGAASKNFRLEIDGKEIVNSTKLSSVTDSKIAKYNQFLIRMKNAGADASIDIDNFIVEKFNFPNLQVSDPMFYQGDTNDVMNDLNDADVLRTKVEFTVGEDEPETENAVVIVALYEGNTDKYTLVQAATGIAALRQGEKTIAEVKLDLSGFTSTQRDNMFVNIMVWDGLGSMQPLVPCKSMQ